jgi:outer membrane protein insertion porin family
MRILRKLSLAALLAVVGGTALAKDNSDRLQVHSVNFSGNQVFSSSRLHKVMVMHSSHLFSRFYFQRNILDDDLKSLELFYRQNGYLEATVVDDQVTIDTTRRRVDIEIFVEEGELTHVKEITLHGSRAFSDTLLLKQVKLKSGDAFEQPKLQQGTLAIVQKYADNGYLDAEVRPEVSINSQDHLANIDVKVIEGPQYTIIRFAFWVLIK